LLATAIKGRMLSSKGSEFCRGSFPSVSVFCVAVFWYLLDQPKTSQCSFTCGLPDPRFLSPISTHSPFFFSLKYPLPLSSCKFTMLYCSTAVPLLTRNPAGDFFRDVTTFYTVSLSDYLLSAASRLSRPRCAGPVFLNCAFALGPIYLLPKFWTACWHLFCHEFPEPVLSQREYAANFFLPTFGLPSTAYFSLFLLSFPHAWAYHCAAQSTIVFSKVEILDAHVIQYPLFWYLLCNS